MAMKRPAAASGGAALKRPAAAGAVALKRPAAAGVKSGRGEASLPLSPIAVAPRKLAPADIVFGGVWLGPWPGGPVPVSREEEHSQEAANEAVRTAHAAGITEFDTAPLYGRGSSEERLGKAVTELGLSEKSRITTKAGVLLSGATGRPVVRGFDSRMGVAELSLRKMSTKYTAEGMEQSLFESLSRMGLSKVWGLRIHDPNDNCNNRRELGLREDEVAIAVAPGGAVEGLRKLRERGLIQHVGLGMNSNREKHQGVPDDIIRLIASSPEGTFDSALLAGGWNLLCQDGLPCLLECERRGIDVYVAGVYASGLLVGGTTYAYEAAPPEMLERADRWRALATKFRISLPAVAVAFAALPRCVAKVVIGMATKAQVEETLETVKASAAVPMELFHEARELGLLPKEVPLPPL